MDTLPSGAIAVTSDPAVEGLPPEGLSVQELWRVGNARGNPRDTLHFGRIEGLGIGADGTAYVLDRSASLVHMIDSSGHVLGTFGGVGEGPGEFVMPRGLLVSGDGRVWVRDGASDRYTLFAADGTFLDTFSRSMHSGLEQMIEGHDGLIWEPGRTYEGLRPREWGVMDAITSFEIPDQEAPPTWDLAGVPVASGAVIGGELPVPFALQSRDCADPRGGYWHGNTGALRFVRRSAHGDTVRIIERLGSPPELVTAELEDRAIAEMLGLFGDEEEQRRVVREALEVERSEIPERMPYWEACFVDDQGRLWVERFRPPGTPARAPRTWELYSAEGVYLGALELPIGGDLRPVVRDDRLIGVATDEMGVEVVLMFRMEQG